VFLPESLKSALLPRKIFSLAFRRLATPIETRSAVQTAFGRHRCMPQVQPRTADVAAARCD